ncbi:hypothetical protein JZ785_22610 [Alicyclobacillus curvatus]|nr:hypothetical protein JZ785_22610 [Alicyclobacillus curvatus]
MTKKLQVIVYHHTHWDREWWAPFQEIRFRLVELIDELLDTLESDPEFQSFVLDGQTIVLEDYLEIRPENRQRLLNFIRNGRIYCGPWYILPDEFLVSAEAHIRNLWLGEKVSQQLGFDNLNVGYIPDTFGHISQMPQILSGFGFDNAMIWRGLGGSEEEMPQEFWWESPDGSRVFTYWFPDGYYVVDFLHFDNPDKSYDETYGRVRASLERWSKRATTNYLLMPYGGDHRKIDKRLPRILKQVNEEFEDFAELTWGTTKDFMDRVKRAQPELTVRHGELRANGQEYPHLLPGVVSSRMYLKQRNFGVQTELEKYSEPLSAAAWLRGGKYDYGMLWKAWQTLIKNHPHDSICGCSLDEVHREMLPRFDESLQMSRLVTRAALEYINGRIATDTLAEGETPLIVHNTLLETRSESVRMPIGHQQPIAPRTHEIVDESGVQIPWQVREIADRQTLTDKWGYTEVEFVASNVPGLGHKTYRLRARTEPQNNKQVNFNAVQSTSELKGSVHASDLRIGNHALENDLLKVVVERDGTLTLTEKTTGQVYSGLNAFVDGGDAGDTYNYSAPLVDEVRCSIKEARVHVSVSEAGTVSSTLRVELTWLLPKELSSDRLCRSSEYVLQTIVTHVTLKSLSPVVSIRTEIDHRILDHRLQALFPLGAEVKVAHAEGHFDVVERAIAAAESGNGWPETPTTNWPQQGYVSVSDVRTGLDSPRGLTIANRGLPEYEILDDGTGTVALTLLRAVGWLSREDLLTRRGGAGPEIPVPDAQCPGPQVFEYAIIPHGESGWNETGAFREAHRYLAPLVGAKSERHSGTLSLEEGLITLEGESTLVQSSIKKAEHGDRLIVRLWNASAAGTEATLRFSRAPKSVCYANLKEEEVGAIVTPVDDHRFMVSAGAKQIVTLSISF